MPTSRHDQSSHAGAMLWLCMAVMVVAVIGGGGQGDLGDTSAQLLALLLLGFLGWLAVHHRLSLRSAKWVRWLPILALVLPVLQLLPIPWGWWSAAPARAELAGQLAAAGVSPMQVISLNPGATEGALWWLLPPVALFLATLCLPGSGHRWLLATIVVLALLSVVLGLAQLAGGPTSALRFYSNTNTNEAVGFFANRNHLATLLVMALPVSLVGIASAMSEGESGRRISPLWLFCGSGVVILLILGIAMSRSRAGLLLGMLAFLGSLPIVLGVSKQRGLKRVLAVAVGVAVMLCMQFAMVGILQRLQKDPLDDLRWKYAQITREAATAYAPLGSGLGTFRQAYQPFEALYEPDRTIVNHAHDDYLELWLEGGVPALLLLGLGGLAWGWRGLQLWWPRKRDQSPSGSMSNLLARTAWLSASLALIHSAMDYPLRTTANLAVFAVLAAIAFSEPARRTRSAE